MLRAPLAAIAFLTRVPVPRGLGRGGGADLSAAAPFFPAVGAAIGGMAALLASGLHGALPASVTAVLVVAATTWLTGALHLDGLADTADGLGGGRTRGDALRIMRDHAIGTYGAAAVALDLLLRTVAIAALIDAGRATPALVAAGAISRWTAVPLGAALPYARAEGGLGAAVIGRMRASHVAGAAALAAAVIAPAGGAPGFLWWLGAAALVLLAGLYFRRRLGGVTGDTLGAVIQVSETVVLVLALAVPRGPG